MSTMLEAFLPIIKLIEVTTLPWAWLILDTLGGRDSGGTENFHSCQRTCNTSDTGLSPKLH